MSGISVAQLKSIWPHLLRVSTDVTAWVHLQGTNRTHDKT